MPNTVPENTTPPFGVESLRRERLRRFINHPTMDLTVAFLIILSVVLLVVEIVWHLKTAQILGDIITAIFIVELTIRFYVARSKAAYFSYYWLDIISVIPVFRSWRVLRVIRLVRLFRLGAILFRANKRLASIIRQSFGEHLSIVTMVAVTVLGVALAIFEIEKDTPEFQTFGATIWWATLSIIAAEPVGGMPQSEAGKFFTLIIMLAGLTVFALFTGTVSAVMAERIRHGLRSNRMNLDDLRDHVIICGWNRSARVVVEELHTFTSTRDRAVIVIAEIRPDAFDEIDGDPLVYFIEDDYTRMDVLRKAGIERASRAILLADRSISTRSDQDRDARTILAALMIEKLSPGIFACAELLSRENEEHLVLAGIEEIVIGDEYSGTLLAASSRVRGVTEIADELFSNKFGNQIYKLPIRKEWIGNLFLDVQCMIKIKYDAMLIAIERGTQNGGSHARRTPGENSPYARTVTNPPAEYKLEPADKLIVLAKEEPVWHE